MSEQAPTLALAMAQVGDAVRYLQKRGRNDAQHYNYVLEADVKEAFHREFQRRGIVFATSVQSCETDPHMKGESRSGYLVTLTLECQLRHVESGEVAVYTAIGQGYDSLDKAANKAYTSAVKNFLLTTFLVATGDDSERDEDGEPMNIQAMEDAFDEMAKSLKAVEPTKGEHKTEIATIMSHYKTQGGRPVEYPNEFKSRGDARACLAALQQLERMWAKQDFTAESQSGKAKA